MDEVIREFLVESLEGLEGLDQELLSLEQDPSNSELVASLFRTLHTIKGSAGFLGFERLEKTAHVAENLLGRVREGSLKVDGEMVKLLLEAAGFLRRNLEAVEQTGEEDDADCVELLERMLRLQEDLPVPTSPAAQTPSASQAGENGGPTGRDGDCDAEVEGFPVPSGAGGGLTETTLRVKVEVLNRLMNLVGELVITRNRILQLGGDPDSRNLRANTQRLSRIVGNLQEEVMKARLQTIGNAWTRFPLLVRELAETCGKRVRLVTEGQATEIDKTILEAIKDPLTHIVRNCVDHGIEAPEVREACDKPVEGRLVLRAFHEEGRVVVEAEDDGAGIDGTVVAQKALQSGLLDGDRLGRMSERELQQLVFLPGFSTASSVTSLSGRGVGLDVVRTNVERVGGSVALESVKGKGTKLRVTIPLTLAILPALIVYSRSRRYAVPRGSLVELLKLDPGQGENRLERVAGAPVVRCRDRLLPLVHLDRLLADPPADPEREGYVLVLQSGTMRFGLVVDEVHDLQEIVVKPLGILLKGVEVFSGSAILGDGRVALILDPAGVAMRAGLAEPAAIARQAFEEKKPAREEGETRRLLLLKVNGTDTVGIPLSEISRLEEIPRDAVERSGGREVVQYRDGVLPLLHLGPALFPLENRRSTRDPLTVVVHGTEERRVGFVVDEVVDVVEETLKVQRTGLRPGVHGLAVVRKRVTALLDAEALVEGTNCGPSGARS